MNFNTEKGIIRKPNLDNKLSLPTKLITAATAALVLTACWWEDAASIEKKAAEVRAQADLVSAQAALKRAENELRDSQLQQAQLQSWAERQSEQAPSVSQLIAAQCKDAWIVWEQACVEYLSGQNNALWQMARDYKSIPQSSWSEATSTNFWDFAQTAIIAGWLTYAWLKLLDAFSPKYREPFSRSVYQAEKRLSTRELSEIRRNVPRDWTYRLTWDAWKKAITSFKQTPAYKVNSTTINWMPLQPKKPIDSLNKQTVPWSVVPKMDEKGKATVPNTPAWAYSQGQNKPYWATTYNYWNIQGGQQQVKPVTPAPAVAPQKPIIPPPVVTPQKSVTPPPPPPPPPKVTFSTSSPKPSKITFWSSSSSRRK